jgi:hypothetical protein
VQVAHSGAAKSQRLFHAVDITRHGVDMRVEQSRNQRGSRSRNSSDSLEVASSKLSSANFIDKPILDDDEAILNELMTCEDLDFFNDKGG